MQQKDTSLLRNSEQQLMRYKQVLEVMPAGVILLDPFGYVVEVNPESLCLLGEPLMHEKWSDVIARAFQPREDDGHEVSLRDGKRVKLAISASNAGQLILITDMTETRLLQARVSSLQRLSSLGNMIASLAHQVRTPLSAALLYAANLSSPKLSQAMRDDFQSKLVERLHHIEKQVNDMLFFAKGGDNKVANFFSVEQLLNEFEPMVEALVSSQQADFAIVSERGSLVVYGNVNALASALSNLVINAIQVSGKNCKVRLSATAENGELCLAVSDNGPGISADLHSKIFEPFFTTRQQGSGLGLAIVQMICHAHQGYLKLESEVNRGACFTLCIPLIDQKIATISPKEVQNESI